MFKILLPLLVIIFGYSSCSKSQNSSNTALDEVAKVQIVGPNTVVAGNCEKGVINTLNSVGQQIPVKKSLEIGIADQSGGYAFIFSDNNCIKDLKERVQFPENRTSMDVFFIAKKPGMLQLRAVHGGSQVLPTVGGEKILVKPGVPTQMKVDGIGPEFTPGHSFNITVTFLDFFGNIATGFEGPVSVSFLEGSQDDREGRLKDQVRAVIKDGVIPKRVQTILLRSMEAPDAKKLPGFDLIKPVIESGRVSDEMFEKLLALPVPPQALEKLELVAYGEGVRDPLGTPLKQKNAKSGVVEFLDLRIPKTNEVSGKIVISANAMAYGIYPIKISLNGPRPYTIVVDGVSFKAEVKGEGKVSFPSGRYKGTFHFNRIGNNQLQAKGKTFNIISETLNRIELKSVKK